MGRDGRQPVQPQDCAANLNFVIPESVQGPSQTAGMVKDAHAPSLLTHSPELCHASLTRFEPGAEMTVNQLVTQTRSGKNLLGLI